MNRAMRFLPIMLVLWVVSVFALRLIKPGDTAIPSQLVNRPLPALSLAPALPNKPGLMTGASTKSSPRLLNIFASWCIPCGQEAPVLSELKRRGVRIDAIAVRDRPEAIARFLAEHGNPYDRIGADPRSEAQMMLGSSGVPETFVIDGRGVIRHQYVGALERSNIDGILGELGAAQ